MKSTATEPSPMFATDRYERMPYNRCGRSGLKLPVLSLGMWHNWGNNDKLEEARRIMRRAFDLGITLFDLANNYGPPPGSAEINTGLILRDDFQAHRDELIVTSKAGHPMHPGPYGDWGSRKYLVSSCDASLKRLGLDYVDIFYHHRMDPETPLEESIGALDYIVRSGRALYAGISNYDAGATRRAQEIATRLGTPLIINQVKYSMLWRTPETEGWLDAADKSGLGVTTFSPLAQGLLTDKYIDAIPPDSRAAKENTFLKQDQITPELQAKLRKLQALALRRGQTVAQLALTWIRRDPRVTSILIGASRVGQIEDCHRIVDSPPLTQDELTEIEGILKQ
jgi:L-glyceraldehyde 3-phosphate reductase